MKTDNNVNRQFRAKNEVLELLGVLPAQIYCIIANFLFVIVFTGFHI